MTLRRFTRSVRVRVPLQELFNWHERAGAFERLAPPWMHVRVHSREGGIRDGATATIISRILGVPSRWRVRHMDYTQYERFVDEMLEGPFARWVHRHEFAADGNEASVLSDDIEYELPLGRVGDALAAWHARRTLTRVFRYRHAVMTHDLIRHAAFRDRPRMRIAVTGATGFIGRALCAFLESGGHNIVRIGRGPVRPGYVDVSWDPLRAELDSGSLENVDAVVHLAGAPIAKRWTEQHRRAIRESRIRGTELIARTIASMTNGPAILLSGSAIGVYGANRGDEILDESSDTGDDFLAQVAREWEAATKPAAESGVRVVHLRTGIVTGVGGGALGKQWPLFQMGLGGPLGHGSHYMSCIALDDEVGAIHHCLMDDRIIGPVNLVAPEAVTNSSYARQVGSAISRPAILPAPVPAMAMIFGREMIAATALASQRVRPVVLSENGFRWAWPTVEQMVSFETGRADYPLHDGQ